MRKDSQNKTAAAHEARRPFVVSACELVGPGGIVDTMPMTVREAIRKVEADGWRQVATRGSHRQYKHPTRSGRVTIPGKPGDNLSPGTASSILKQAGLK